ncbi:DUF86 domain-containing protein [Candidatus Woesearchaeota archaeon]|nr:DUF86 domain-containing protein [Candidatus Woesearchaeota archaeon]
MKRIEQKLREIEDSLAVIDEGIPENEEDFSSAGLIKDGIYKRLEFCIQNVIDIFSMIYSSQRLGVPGTVDDIFTGFLKKGLFPKKIILLAEEMKGMRNVLVHKYGEIDDARVYAFLTERMGDFQKIVGAVEEYLKKQEKKNSGQKKLNA